MVEKQVVEAADFLKAEGGEEFEDIVDGKTFGLIPKGTIDMGDEEEFMFEASGNFQHYFQARMRRTINST